MLAFVAQIMREFDERLPSRKSAATKLFRLISLGNRSPQNFFSSFPQEIGRHKTFSAHFLRKSAATNFFSSFPQEIGRHKTFSAHFLRKSAATNFFGSFPQEIGRSLTHSFPQEIAGWSSTHFLRKSAGCGSPPCQTHDTLRGAYFD